MQMPPAIDQEDEWGDLGSGNKQKSEEKKLEIKATYNNN